MVSRQLVVAIKIGGTVVGGKQQIEISVTIEVGQREAAADFRLIESSAGFGGDPAKDASPPVQKKLRRLGIPDVAPNIAHGFINVAVRDCEVEPAIQVNVKKRAAKAQAISRGHAHSGLRRDILETPAVGAIESDHFIIEVGNGDSGHAVILEIGGVDPHAGASLAFAAEGESGFYCRVFEGAIVLVAVKLVGLRVVGHEHIGPAITVTVEQSYAQRFRTAVEDSAGRGDVFKCSVAAIVKQPARGSAIGFRRAIRLMFSVQAAEDVMLGRPLYIITDKKIQA